MTVPPNRPAKPAAALLSALSLALGLAVAGCAAAQSADWPVSGAQGSQAVRTLDAMGPGRAAGACLSRPVVLAEEVMKLHTELMVTSLSCAEVYNDQTLYPRFRDFTVTHADLLRTTQRTLEEHLGGSERAFDTWRTELANAETLRQTAWDVPLYCTIRQSRFNSLIGASPASLNAYAEEMALRRLSRDGGC